MKTENIPFFAIAGAMLLISMVMYTTNAINFTSLLLPTYLTQILVYLALGYATLKGHGKAGFTIFLMTLVWMFNQILQWSYISNMANLTPTFTTLYWLLLLVQGGLAVMFFRNKPLKFVPDSSGAGWPYASYWVILIFGLAKLALNFWLGQTLVQMTLWGASIFLISLGYVIQGFKKKYALPILAVGTLLAAYSALTIGASGLSLV